MVKAALNPTLPLFIALLASPCPGFAAAGPANDSFAARITLAGTNATSTGTNVGATKEAGEPDHAGNPGGNSVWWTWTAPADGEVTLDTDGSGFDTLLAVYLGTAVSSLSAVATNDDHGVQVTSRVRFEVLKSAQYQIAVDGFNDGTNVDTGDVTLTLSFIPGPILRPANDSFANAFPLSGASLTTTGSNVEATRETGEPLHAGETGDTSVWWIWAAPIAGNVRISTEESTFDTLLAVYRGSNLTNLAEVASGDDIDPAGGLLTSAVNFDSPAGETYRIAVDGFDGASGEILLRIDIANVSLGNPRRLPDGTFQFTLDSPAGRTCQIDASAELTTWTAITTLLNTNGTVVVTDPAATNLAARFYRGVLKP